MSLFRIASEHFVPFQNPSRQRLHLPWHELNGTSEPNGSERLHQIQTDSTWGLSDPTRVEAILAFISNTNTGAYSAQLEIGFQVISLTLPRNSLFVPRS